MTVNIAARESLGCPQPTAEQLAYQHELDHSVHVRQNVTETVLHQLVYPYNDLLAHRCGGITGEVEDSLQQRLDVLLHDRRIQHDEAVDDLQAVCTPLIILGRQQREDLWQYCV